MNIHPVPASEVKTGSLTVAEYEFGPDSITVQFNDGAMYLYNSVRPGSADVKQMKYLANAGVGLNSYISKHVKKNYAAKLR